MPFYKITFTANGADLDPHYIPAEVRARSKPIHEEATRRRWIVIEAGTAADALTLFHVKIPNYTAPRAEPYRYMGSETYEWIATDMEVITDRDAAARLQNFLIER